MISSPCKHKQVTVAPVTSASYLAVSRSNLYIQTANYLKILFCSAENVQRHSVTSAEINRRLCVNINKLGFPAHTYKLSVSHRVIIFIIKFIFTNYESYIKIQSVPRSKHTPSSVIKTSQLMLYREIIAVCSQIHTKHINTLCGQNVELLNVKLAVYMTTLP